MTSSSVCNCSFGAGNGSSAWERECQLQLSQLLARLNGHLANEFRKQPDNVLSQDLYTCFILICGAFTILLLMVRVIKPQNENVTYVFSSMHDRCEVENNLKHKARLRDAKRRVQRFMNEAKLKSMRKLSFRRSRSTSESAGINSCRTESLSIKSQLVARVSTPQKRAAQRAASFQFLPSIVVTETGKFEEETPPEDAESSVSSRPMSSSRASSSQSLDEISRDSYELDPFMQV